jgi:HEAT repeat protein
VWQAELTIRFRRALPLLLDLLDDPVQQIIEELVSVLMHRASEEFVELLEFLDERSGSDGALVARVFRNVYKKRPEGGRERSWCRWYRRTG